ncbi:DUF1203 domain-containing protein [Lysobacter cavernae]|uniref:DUF1203 domain-containing protein n=1 Tax=Lysobacter cavernae TaxID=1685901 RepID=A0ABV7RPG3_9GAMM
MVSYRIEGLAPTLFAPLFALDDATLASRDMRRVTVDSPTAYPCRISLVAAQPGETVLLLPFEHHPAASPYRASGPIFVREHVAAATHVDEIPPLLRCRLLSLRGYDADGSIRAATVVEGTSAESALQDLFADAAIVSVHAHNARYGCFLCRIDRL